MPRPAVGRSPFIAFAIASASMCLGACGTEPDAPRFEGSYSVSFDPPLSVPAPGLCERIVTYATLSIAQDGDFDLSINAGDDCRPMGGQFEFFEVYNRGTCTRQHNTLHCVVGTGREPGERFTGQLEDSFIRLVLPPPYGDLATVDVELLLGPRVP